MPHDGVPHDHDHSHEGHHHGAPAPGTVDWKLHGVKVIPATSTGAPLARRARRRRPTRAPTAIRRATTAD